MDAGVARQVADLANKDRDEISGLGRAAPSALQIHRALMERPITTSGWLVKKTGITPATVNKALTHLERLGDPPVSGSVVPDYFDETPERIRDIRAGERQMERLRMFAEGTQFFHRLCLTA